jgi:hypothetical protein
MNLDVGKHHWMDASFSYIGWTPCSLLAYPHASPRPLFDGKCYESAYWYWGIINWVPSYHIQLSKEI